MHPQEHITDNLKPLFDLTLISFMHPKVLKHHSMIMNPLQI